MSLITPRMRLSATFSHAYGRWFSYLLGSLSHLTTVSEIVRSARSRIGFCASSPILQIRGAIDI